MAFPFCGHSHCLKCVIAVAKRETPVGGMRCPTCVREQRRQWVRDNGRRAEADALRAARDAIADEQIKADEAAEAEQGGAGARRGGEGGDPDAFGTVAGADGAVAQGSRLLVVKTLRDMRAATVKLDDNADPRLPWVKSVRWRALTSLRPNSYVDDIVGKLNAWTATMTHNTTTLGILARALESVARLKTADDLLAVASAAGVMGAPLPVAPRDHLDEASALLQSPTEQDLAAEAEGGGVGFTSGNQGSDAAVLGNHASDSRNGAGMRVHFAITTPSEVASVGESPTREA